MVVLALGLYFHGTASPRNSRLIIISCNSANLDMGRRTDSYKVLSLESRSVGLKEIKKAYRSLALKWHPDLCPPSKKKEFTRMFVELHKAYKTLSDPTLRRKHDEELRMSEMEWKRMVDSEFSRKRWEDQICELKRRSDNRERKKAVHKSC